MPIEIQCHSCSKRYRVDDRFAGKRVKCSNCAASISVPGLDDDQADLSGLLGAGGEDSSAVTTVAKPPVDPQAFDDASPHDDEPLPQGFGAALQAARSRSSNRRFHLLDFPGAAFAHRYLPWVVGVVCMGLTIHMAVQMILAARPAWPLATHLGIILVLFLIAVIPLTARGLRTAGVMLHFDLPEHIHWRTLGLFSLPLVLAMALSDSLAGVIAGLAVGILMLWPLIWVAFQLHWVEAVVAWMMSSLFFAATSAVVAGVSFIAGLAIAVSTTGTDPKPPSKPIAKAPPVTRPTDAGATRPATGTQPTAPETVATTVPSTPPSGSTATRPTTGEGILSLIPEVMLPPVSPTPETNPTPPVPPKPEAVEITPSPIVAEAKDLQLSEINHVLEIEGPSPLAIRKRQGDQVTVEVIDHRQDKIAGSVSFQRDINAADRYIVSPAGDAVVRLASWPKLSLQVWSTADARMTRSIDLDETGSSATPIGFIAADQVLLRREKAAMHGIQLWNLRTGLRGRQQSVAPMNDNGYALSADGKYLAIAARENAARENAARENAAQLQMLELATGRLRRFAIALDPRWPVTPAGLAFSADSSRVGILFEQQGNVLAIAWNTASGLKTHEHLYPAGMLTLPAKGTFHGRALDWIADNNTWLLFGRTVLDVPSGQVISTLGVEPVVGQRVIDGKKIYLEAKLESGTKRLVKVDLNLDAMTKIRAAFTPALGPK